MKKLKLFAIGNEENFNYYIFEKKKGVLETLAKVFSKVFNLELMLYDIDNMENGKCKSRKRNIKNIKDYHESLGSISGKSRIDIFYGSKKIFVSIYCSEKLRLKFNEELAKISFMPKIGKIKKGARLK